MKKGIILTVVVACINMFTHGQEEKVKSSIAVALPNIENISVSREIVAKLIQIELIKLGKYQVYDEFDVQEVMNTESKFKEDCYGKNCLVDMGRALNVDYIVSSSLIGFGNKTIISFKIINVETENIFISDVHEFIDDKSEIQRMLEIVIRKIHDLPNQKELLAKISFDQKPIIKSPVGKINNSGPRVGYSFLTGDLYEFAKRPVDQGGLDIHPHVSMFGYQLEKQYIGTENFSALGEVLFNVSGLEKGLFMPSVIFMNGLRFGKQGWEFAFGPGFGIARYSNGFFDTHGIYGEEGEYWSVDRFWDKHNKQYDAEGNQTNKIEYDISRTLDAQGNDFRLNTRWVMGFGRTFRSGGLNIPVNIFYSSMRNSGTIGVSVGFNVVKE